MKLKEALLKLAQARCDLAKAGAAVEAQRKIINSSPAGIKLVRLAEKKAILMDQTEQAYDQVRDLALAAFKVTADKAPALGVAIKLFKRLEYSEAEVFAWCEEHAKAFIQHTINWREFEKVGAKLPGAPVREVLEPHAQIASDLSAYLAEGADATVNAEAEADQATAEKTAPEAEQALCEEGCAPCSPDCSEAQDCRQGAPWRPEP